MLSRSAFFRYPLWSHSRPGTTPQRSELLQTPSRKLFCATSLERAAHSSTQAYFPSLGRHRYHSVYLPPHLHLHRSEEQLSPWQHSHYEVCLITSSCAAFAYRPLSYLVLLAGFYFAPQRPEEIDIGNLSIFNAEESQTMGSIKSFWISLTSILNPTARL